MAQLYRRTSVQLTGLAIIALGAWFLGMCMAYGFSSKTDVILPKVTIAGIRVGGLQTNEAAALVRAGVKAKIERPIHLVWNGGEQFIYPADDGIRPDLEAMVTDALLITRSGNIFRRVWDRYRVLVRGVDIPLQITGTERLDQVLLSVSKRVSRPAQDAGLHVNSDGTVRVIPSQQGLEVDLPALREAVLATAAELDREVVVPLSVTAPTYTTSQARAWGIRHVVASYETRFSSGDRNRSHNLKLAADALNGTVLAPGETFSFNKRVGPRAQKLGYKEAPVVIGGELVPDVGGGVCQVSSTLYNAVILAGLKVNYRSSHSIPSTYVPLGQDAAVAYDYLDFRFTNSTTGYLYLKTTVKSNRLEVALLGPDPGPKARIVSRIESVKPVPIEQIRDQSLPAGHSVVEQKGAKGYTVSVWRVRPGANGEHWELVSRSEYKPRPQVTRVGTGGMIPREENPS